MTDLSRPHVPKRKYKTVAEAKAALKEHSESGDKLGTVYCRADGVTGQSQDHPHLTIHRGAPLSIQSRMTSIVA